MDAALSVALLALGGSVRLTKTQHLLLDFVRRLDGGRTRYPTELART